MKNIDGLKKIIFLEVKKIPVFNYLKLNIRLSVKLKEDCSKMKKKIYFL